MRSLIILVCLLMSCFLQKASSQNSVVEDLVANTIGEGGYFTPVEILSYDNKYKPDDGGERTIRNVYYYDLQLLEVRKILNNALGTISITLQQKGNNSMTLLLVEVPDRTYNYKIRSSLGDYYRGNRRQGMHYRGIVQGSSNSIVALSIYPGEIAGVISTEEEGTFNLGKMEGLMKHSLYNVSELGISQFRENNIDSLASTSPKTISADSSQNCQNCISVYVESDYQMYIENGSVQATVNKIIGIWNVVSTLYENDSMCLILSEIFVWATPDSYSVTNALDALNSFRTSRPNFNGDVAILIASGPNPDDNGGLAYKDQLCGSSPYAYVNIFSNYNPYPTYSFTVHGIAHELGHVLGACHTHDCVWNGNSTAIDGCGEAAGFPGSGTCLDGPVPATGGTIMSYCHLITGIGIDFLEGFHPQVAQLLQGRISTSQCIGCYFECSGGAPLANVMSTTSDQKSNIRQENSLINVPYQESALNIYPHPVTGVSLAEFTLSEDELVSMAIYDFNGRIISTPFNNKFFSAGKHLVEIKSSDFPVNGLFILTTSSNSKRLSKLISVLK